MTALPSVPGVVMCTMKHIFGDATPAISRFFTKYTGTAPTNAQLVTFAGALSTAWNSNLASLFNSGGLLEEVDTIDLSSPSGAVGADTTSHTGTRGTTIIGASSCLVSSYRIARRFRGGHSRGYWPFGISTDLSDPNTWKSTFLTAADTGLNAFFAAVVAAGWTGAGTLSHVSVSYYTGFTVVTNPITGRARNVPTLRGTPLVDAVIAIKNQPRVGSQRRRDG